MLPCPTPWWQHYEWCGRCVYDIFLWNKKEVNNHFLSSFNHHLKRNVLHSTLWFLTCIMHPCGCIVHIGTRHQTLIMSAKILLIPLNQTHPEKETYQSTAAANGPSRVQEVVESMTSAIVIHGAYCITQSKLKGQLTDTLLVSGMVRAPPWPPPIDNSNHWNERHALLYLWILHY